MQEENKLSKENTKKEVAGAGGKTVTALSMFPQGLLAGLLLDEIIKMRMDDPNPIMRAVAFSVFAYTAFEGKRRLITYLNAKGFEALAETEIKAFFKDLRYDYLRMFNYVCALVPSLGFAYLAKLAHLGSAKFLQDYDTHGTDIVASIVAHPATIVIFAVSSFCANLVGFPAIQRAGFSSLKKLLATIFAPQDKLSQQLKAEARLNALINPLVKDFNTAVKDLHKNEDNIAQRSIPFTQPAVLEGSNAWARASSGLALLAGAYTALGLSNFFTIGAEIPSGLLGLPKNTWVNTLFGIMMMTSMTCMSMFVAIAAENFLAGRDPARAKEDPEVLRPAYAILLPIFSFVVCALGVGTNVYQSLVISEQDLFLVIAAAIAPFVLEYGGFKTLTRQGFEKKALNKLAEKAPHIEEYYEHIQRLRSVDPNNPSQIAAAVVSCQASALVFSSNGQERAKEDLESAPLLR